MSSKTTKQAAPTYSIVIPAYNEADYISDTIESLEDQTFDGNYEIIVVDNNSTDDTYEIAKKGGVKVVKEKNVGVCWARQKGSEQARGGIIISADADTIYSRGWLEKIDKTFKKRPHLVAIAGPCIFSDAPAWGRIYPKLLFGLVTFGFKTFRKTFYGSGTNIAFKKSAWEGYDTSLTQGGDELDLLSKLRKKGCVYFDNKNPTYTSSRRLTRGFFYNFFVTFLTYYILEYYLSKAFKRPILGQAPKFRSDSKPHKLIFIRAGVFLIIFLIILIGVVKTRHIVLASPIHFNVINNIFG